MERVGEDCLGARVYKSEVEGSGSRGRLQMKWINRVIIEGKGNEH